jgi:hypothetical protein
MKKISQEYKELKNLLPEDDAIWKYIGFKEIRHLILINYL